MMFFFLCFYVFVWILLFLVDLCLESHQSKDKEVYDFNQMRFLFFIRMTLNRSIVLIFYDNLLHLLVSVMFVKSMVFGVFDFFLVLFRSSILVYSFWYLQTKEKQVAEYNQKKKYFLKKIDKLKKKSQGIIVGKSFRQISKGRSTFFEKHKNWVMRQTLNSISKKEKTKKNSLSEYSGDRKTSNIGSRILLQNLKKRSIKRQTSVRNSQAKRFKPTLFSNFHQMSITSQVDSTHRKAENIRKESIYISEKSETRNTSLNKILEQKNQEITSTQSKSELSIITNKSTKTTETTDKHKSDYELKEVYIYLKNSLLFALIIFLGNQSIYAWMLVIYVHTLFSILLLIFFGFSNKESSATVFQEVYFGFYLLFYILHFGLVETFPGAESWLLICYLVGLSISMSCFFVELFLKQKMDLRSLPRK